VVDSRAVMWPGPACGRRAGAGWERVRGCRLSGSVWAQDIDSTDPHHRAVAARATKSSFYRACARKNLGMFIV
jgi:hypothetical protein